MSNVSLNNFPRLTTDFNQQGAELPKAVDHKAADISANSARTLLKNSTAVPAQGNVALNKDAFEKLVEMFEYVLRAMRSMLFGPKALPTVVPDAAPLPRPEKSGDCAVKNKLGGSTDAPNAVPGDKAGNTPAVPRPGFSVPSEFQTLLSKDPLTNNRSSADVNVTVQVKNCYCPHADTPKADVTRPDAPKPDAPKPDAPKPDAPKPVVPMPDVPKPDAPKPVVPKSDASKPDAPRPDAPMPVVPMPVVPKSDAPKPDAPTPDAPKPDAPTPDVPTPDVTAPGPAEDDGSEVSTHDRRRAYDNHWRFNPGRRVNR